MKATTTRVIQLSSLICTALAEAGVSLRAADNAASINNQTMRTRFLARATQLTRAAHCAQRLLEARA